MKSNPKFVLVGGGLGGALCACYLGRAGHQVEVYEMRDDLREGSADGGKSINLAISHRGLCALDRVGLKDKILEMAVPMHGRMIHSLTGELTFQPYGKDRTQAINSVSRGELNAVLLDAADQHPNVDLHFDRKCTGVDLDAGSVELLNTTNGETTTATGDIIVSADGAFSVVRRRMQGVNRFDYQQDYLKHGYKELVIPAQDAGGFRMERNALHIWPRRSFMMIALPNFDGSYTCTLFWPFEGPFSFASVENEKDLLGFFERHFPDAIELMPALVEDYFANPVGSLVTVRCKPWFYKDRAVLLGDACHAVVPFYGQGANAAFEDVLVLDERMREHAPDWRRAFAEYSEIRQPHVNILADMAISNFIEMRDHTGSRRFLFKKKLEKFLHGMFPTWYVPLYSLATFTRTPYGEAIARAKRQDRIVATAAMFVLMLLLAGVLFFVL